MSLKQIIKNIAIEFIQEQKEKQMTNSVPEKKKSRKAALALITNSNGEILLVSRKNDSAIFGLPGGKAEEDESLINALKRECLEEIGANVRVGQLLFTHHNIYVYECTLNGEFSQQNGEGIIKWGTWDILVSEETGVRPDFNQLLYLTLFGNKGKGPLGNVSF